MRMSNLGHGFNVQHIAAGIADSLGEQNLGLVAHRPFPRIDFVGIHEVQINVELTEDVFQLCDRATIERLGRNDVVTRDAAS